MECVSGHLRRQGAGRGVGAGAGGAGRAAELSSGDRADRRELDRLPLHRPVGPPGARHGASDAEKASGGACRRRGDIRRDSPNGKRYARKGRGGDIELAFGFDLGPIVARAEEFEAWAEEVRAEERALKLVRERITICRRDLAKMIATGLEEGVATQHRGQGPASWAAIHAHFRRLVGQIPRNATRAELEPIAEEMSLLADEVLNLLEMHNNNRDMSANESHFERHKQNSNTESLTDLEPRFQESRGGNSEPQVPTQANPTSIGGLELAVSPERLTDPRPVRSLGGDLAGAGRSSLGQAYPLGMVLDACPDIVDYARNGVANWRDFLATASVVRSMLGVSPSAWDAAQAVLGEIPAAIVVAAILQRGAEINSAGGYLRSLTARAKTQEFSIGPMLMALIGSRKREKKRA